LSIPTRGSHLATGLVGGRLLWGGDAETHTVVLNLKDDNTDLIVNDDLLTDFAPEHEHSFPPVVQKTGHRGATSPGIVTILWDLSSAFLIVPSQLVGSPVPPSAQKKQRSNSRLPPTIVRRVSIVVRRLHRGQRTTFNTNCANSFRLTTTAERSPPHERQVLHIRFESP
jgi:hypothetical protein